MAVPGVDISGYSAQLDLDFLRPFKEHDWLLSLISGFYEMGFI